MGKRTHRWTPPHTDRPKRSEPPLDQGVFPGEHPTCTWPGCEQRSAFWLRSFVCEEHGRAVHAMVNEHDDPLIIREARDRHRQALDENTRRIEAGERVDVSNRTLVPGWIYYALIDGLIKIGYASSVPDRMRQYPPTTQLLAVEPGTLRLERERHQHFGHSLAKGREWFTDTPDLREWIATVVTEYGTADDLAPRWGREQKRPVVASKRIRGGRAL